MEKLVCNVVCKVCFESENVTSLTEEVLINFLEKIASCFRINIVFDDSLSAICSKCVFALNSAYKFRNKCIALNERHKDVSLEGEILINKYTPIQENIIERKDINEISVVKGTKQISSGPEIKDEEYKRKEIFQCSICKKILKNEDSLTKHKLLMHVQRKHHGKVTGTGVNRRYHCTKCSYNTPHSQTLVNHIRTHTGDRPYSCECGKTFTQSSSLAAHRKVHSRKTFYTCSECGKQFKHAFSLKKHQFVHESGKFVCDICNKILKSQQSLQDHKHRHYNVRNYSCEDCGNTFVTGSELHNHRKIHGEFKCVECHVCGYKTHRKKNLIIHLKRHTGEKSYKCDSCSLLFYTSGDLKRHQRVHTKNKPYTCPTCAQRFSHSPSLNKHMLTVHGVLYKWGDFKFKRSQKILEDKNNIK